MPHINLPPGFGPISLAAGEVVQTMVTLDLNRDRHFSQGFLILTNARLLVLHKDTPLEAWPLDSNLALDASVLGGLGKLKLSRNGQLLAHWWFTAQLNSQIDRFVGQFQASLKSRDALADNEDPLTCPSCGFVLSSDDPVCPHCTPVAAPRPPTRSAA